MIRSFFPLLCIVGLLLACSKSDSDYQSSGYKTVVINGFVARNDVGEELTYIGNPDIRISYPTETFPSDLYLATYPNPALDNMEVLLFQRNAGKKVKVWMVPATYTSEGSQVVDFIGIPSISGNLSPIFDTVMVLSGASYRFRLKNLPEGYYRIYVKTEGILLWDNLVFSRKKITSYFY